MIYVYIILYLGIDISYGKWPRSRYFILLKRKKNSQEAMVPLKQMWESV
jgi:hypothetical protein